MSDWPQHPAHYLSGHLPFGRPVRAPEPRGPDPFQDVFAPHSLPATGPCAVLTQLAVDAAASHTDALQAAPLATSSRDP